MTGNNTDYRTKGRAVFLAAIMVLSMVAVPIAFTGGAAAATDDVSNASADDVTAGASADTQNVSFDVQLSANSTEEVVVDLSEADAAGAVPYAADVSSDNEAAVVVSDFEIDGTDLIIELEENASSTSSATITAELTHDLSDVGPARSVTVNINDSDSSQNSSDTFNVTGVDVTNDDRRVYAGQFVEATDSDSSDEEIELFRDYGDDNVFEGVETADSSGFVSFATDDLETGADYTLVNESDDVVGNFSLTAPSFSAEFDDESVENQGETTTTVEFDDRTRSTYSVQVTADGLDNDDLLAIFEDSDADVSQTADGVLLTDVSDGDVDANFADIDADDYEFEFDVTDSVGEDTASITVEEGEDADVEFVEDTVEVTQGDTAEFEVEIIGGAEEGTLVIGNFDNDGYQAVVNITNVDDDADTVTVEFNTYTAGDTSGGYDIVTSDDADVELNTVSGNDRQELSSILDAGDYDIYLGGSTIDNANESNVDDFVDDADEIGGLFIDERTAGDMNLWTASSGNAEDIEDAEDVADAAEDGTLTETDTVAFGDALVHQIELDGIGGFLAATGEDDLDEMLEAALTAGVVDIEIIETDESAGANQDPTTLDDTALDADDFEVIYEGGELYVTFTEFPTDSAVWDDGTPEDGDEFTVDLVVSDERLLEVDDDEILTSADEDEFEDDYLVIGSEFSVADREASFDTEEVDDEDVVTVFAEEDQNVTGTTNIAPGSELDIRLAGQGDARFRTTESDLVVQPDGTFSGTFDFSEREVGDEFTADIRGADLASSAETDGVVVEQAAPAAFEVSDLNPTDVSVEQGDVIEVSATIENTGDEEATQDVTFQVDGNELGSEEVTLDGGEDTTVTFSDIDTSDLEPGDYEHGVFTDDSEQTATLTVEEVSDDDSEDDSTDDDSTDDDSTDDDSTDDDSTDDDSTDDDETDDEGGVPGFGVIVALIALIGAAMLAARRNN